MNRVTILSASAGEPLINLYDTAIDILDGVDDVVYFRFNGVIVRVDADTTFEDVYSLYRRNIDNVVEHNKSFKAFMVVTMNSIL